MGQWFAEVNLTTSSVTMLQDRDIYKEDWIGLKKLGDDDRLEFVLTEGKHMQIPDALLIDAFQTYFSPEGESRRGKADTGSESEEL
jgi:palmitoyl-protein thioesterase